ncbi:MAG: efflux RND transporter periplasmic adaptor subunit [bacterium]|nr:efflux RND transporter periplasmic adaptor subunit [bacterium]
MKAQYVMMISMAAALVACGPGIGEDQDHGPGGHSHGEAEAESWAVTAWGQHYGLFPEVDALVVRETAGAHVHVTVLEGFQAVTEGSVTVILTNSAGSDQRFSSTTVVRPGIFNVEINPSAIGEHQLSFEIEVDGVTEVIAGGTVRVGASDHPGGIISQPHDLAQVEGDEEVSFLLEQQWRTAFATGWAAQGSLSTSVTGTAKVEPPSGGDLVLTAPVNGVVRMDEEWPYTGQRTKTGGAMLSLVPTVSTGRSLADLEASVRELEALNSAATARVNRLENLLAREAVSRREVEQARAEATGLEARLTAGKAELAAAEAGRKGRDDVTGLAIAAPFVGRVAEVLVSPGERVEAGTALLRVVRERPVWVRAALTPADAAGLGGGISGLILDTGASAASVEVPAGELRLVAIAPEVDAQSGTVEALIEVERNVDELKPGLHATAQILLPGKIEGVVLPDSAVVDDAGVPVVYVQLDGETFARRVVEVLHRQGELVLVDGVLVGERVVELGGAAIRRASLLASGSVEGHVH